ncbi:MAG: porin family protein [Mucilaginibacter sp.]
MKKIFLSIALLTAGVISAKAQFTVGAKAGVTFSKLNTDEFKSSSVTGYQVGAFARVGTNWFVQPELYLGSSGGKVEAKDNSFDGKVTFTTLNVPVLLGKSFGSEDLNLHVVGGPIYSFILNKDKKFGQNVNDGFDNYKSSALGYQVGAGVDVGKITFDLRYEGGLTKVNDYFDQKQNLWSLTVGFKFL